MQLSKAALTYRIMNFSLLLGPRISKLKNQKVVGIKRRCVNGFLNKVSMKAGEREISVYLQYLFPSLTLTDTYIEKYAIWVTVLE